MKRLALAFSLAALVLPGAARAGISFGVTEDAAKYSSDGGASVFAHLRDLGMSSNAVSVQWDPDRPTTILEKPLLDRVVLNASRYGVRIVFAVYFTRPNAASTTPDGANRFAGFLHLLARTYPQVKDFVVGNEPNYGVFWQPQFDRSGRPLAGAAYEDLLARSYDALKGVDPRIAVIGMGLSPRGNDRPFSRSPSTSPVLFLRDVGQAYRRSGRTRPLMDAIAYHPYPPSSLATPETTTGWPDAGLADLWRIKQGVWDAFHDTAQPTFEAGLGLRVTEIGWQVGVSGASAAAYHGAENVRTIDEATQARMYVDVVRRLSCDSSVTEVLFFHLVDEADLRGFQSGVIRADGSLRPSYPAVRSAIAAGGCSGTPVAWQHTDAVVGAAVTFGPPDAGAPAVTATAQEAAVYRAAVVRADGGASAAQLDALRASVSTAAAVPLRAYRQAAPSLEAPALPGTYVETVLISSAVNPERTSLFVSNPFTLAPPEADEAAPAKAKSVAAPETVPPAVRPEQQSGPRQPPSQPASKVFAVTPSQAPKQRAATSKQRAATPPLRFSGKRPAPPKVTVRASADFRKLSRTHEGNPGSSDLSQLDGGSLSHSAAAPSGVSLDSRNRGRSAPVLFALLVAGAALSAVISVRLLGR